MLKTLAISITTLSLFSILSGCLSGCASFNSAVAKHSFDSNSGSVELEQSKKLIANSEYDQAEPLLLNIAVYEDKNYAEATLLLGKIYDQTAQPEKAILNLREFLQSEAGSQFDILQGKALLLKNLAKVKATIDTAEEKRYITRIMTSKNEDTAKALESLVWTFKFNCDIYCAEEVNYLKEAQLQLLYAIETNPEVYPKAFESLTSSYNFFEARLKEPKLDLEFRKNIGLALYEALQKLKSSHLETSTLASVKTAELINYLEAYQKRIERWLYE